MYMFGEKAVKRLDIDIVKHERKSIFFRPRQVSASVERTSPPTKHPMKNDEAGRPVRIELEHSRAHSEMMDELLGSSQAHESPARLQMLDNEVHDSVVSCVQCHVGSESVKMLMNVCCASKTHARDTTMAWRSWAHPKVPMQCSMVSSRE